MAVPTVRRKSLAALPSANDDRDPGARILRGSVQFTDEIGLVLLGQPILDQMPAGSFLICPISTYPFHRAGEPSSEWVLNHSQ